MLARVAGAQTGRASATLDEQIGIVARIERLPLSRWHVKMRLIIGTATFFDAFVVLALAFALPVLAREWSLTPQQIGLLLSSGFLAQVFGAVFFGWLAERIGRLRVAVYTIVIFGVLSLACSFAWSFTALLVLRFIQGLGLGGELPVAAAYINEMTGAKARGRFFLLYELVFPIGLTTVALVGTWIVPTLGWRALFAIGIVPAILALLMRMLLPESPRWLAASGRLAEADRTLAKIEAAVERETGRPLPPPQLTITAISAADSDWRELFKGVYLKRTISLWFMWGCTYFVAVVIAGWLPSIFRTTFHLPLETALRYGLMLQVIGLVGAAVCALTIDIIGRRIWFLLAFVGSGSALVALYWLGARNAEMVFILVSIGFAFNSSLYSAVYLYTGEVYPTRMRAVGSGASVSVRGLASAASPTLVGLILAGWGLDQVFLVLGMTCFLGGFVASISMIETNRRTLEEISA